MTKEKYLKELEYLLQDINETEREEALAYYRDYLDASQDDIESVILDLGSPEKLAATIRDSINGSYDEHISYGESKIDNERYQQNDEIIEAKIVEEKTTNSFFPDNNQVINIILILTAIVVGVIMLKIVFGFLFDDFPNIIAFILMLILLGIVGAAVMLVVALAFIVYGAITIMSNLAVGLFFLGLGFICVALAFPFALLGKVVIKGVKTGCVTIVDFIRNKFKW